MPPLPVSSICPAIFGGHLNVSHWLAPSLVEHHPHASVWLEILAMLASIAVVVVGINIAYKKFGQGAEEPVFTGFAKFGYHKFYVDEIYNAVFVQPYKAFGSLISRFLEPNVTDILVQAIHLAL